MQSLRPVISAWLYIYPMGDAPVQRELQDNGGEGRERTVDAPLREKCTDRSAEARAIRRIGHEGLGR